jgi:hypothetical protein
MLVERHRAFVGVVLANLLLDRAPLMPEIGRMRGVELFRIRPIVQDLKPDAIKFQIRVFVEGDLIHPFPVPRHGKRLGKRFGRKP